MSSVIENRAIKMKVWKKNYTCKLCGSSTGMRGVIRRHLSLHYSLSYMKKNRKQIFRCNACNELVYCFEDMKIHWRKMHHGKLCCNVCGKLFDDEETYGSHCDTHIDVEKPQTCEICNESFETLPLLRCHYWQHAQEKIKCIVCFRMFKSAEDLHIHRAREECAKPYVCAVCGKNFSRKSGLRLHGRVCIGANQLSDPESDIPELPPDASTLFILSHIQRPRPQLKTYSRVKKSKPVSTETIKKETNCADILPVIKKEPVW